MAHKGRARVGTVGEMVERLNPTLCICPATSRFVPPAVGANAPAVALFTAMVQPLGQFNLTLAHKILVFLDGVTQLAPVPTAKNATATKDGPMLGGCCIFCCGNLRFARTARTACERDTM